MYAGLAHSWTIWLAAFATGLLTQMPAEAAPLSTANYTSRTNFRTLAFSDLTFTNATDAAVNPINVSGSPGDSGNFTLTTKTGVQSCAMSPGAGVALSNVISPSSANSNRAEYREGCETFFRQTLGIIGCASGSLTAADCHALTLMASRRVQSGSGARVAGKPHQVDRDIDLQFAHPLRDRAAPKRRP